ncbi:DUF6924 domain-containing protein [Streptomyces sp. 8L]|uniref:DUF6924 domain-containing protein n=1 Tax=Streptomyces sp. 8L TaxID=2877242 RepID=UPI0035A83436
MLVVRTHGDDGVWGDVLSRMGELPGAVRAGDVCPVVRGPVRRRLIVVDDPGWRGATAGEVRAAVKKEGGWIPDLVLMADERTTADSRLRPLLAFSGTDGDLFWITPRQAALAYLVLHRPYQCFTLEIWAEDAPAESGGRREDAESTEDWQRRLPDPVGSRLEVLDPPPRYEPPARDLPLLLQENWGLLVRTDFSDDAAWASLLDATHHPAQDAEMFCGEEIDEVDDRRFEGASPEQLMALAYEDADDHQDVADVVMIADGASMRDPDHRVLVIPLKGRNIGYPFRMYPDEVVIMVCNLGIGNMSIEDFMD